MSTAVHRVTATLAVIAALAVLAGCATQPQVSLWEHLDYLLWLNAAD